MFDLASLTKVIATTPVVMDLARTGALRLDDETSRYFAEWRGADREGVTIRDLLEHASGLPARLMDRPPDGGRREFEHEICSMPLEYAPRTKSVYSDLDFILLGFLAADLGGSPLSALFDRLKASFDAAARAEAGADLAFHVPADARARCAPTQPLDDDPRRGRTFIG